MRWTSELGRAVRTAGRWLSRNGTSNGARALSAHRDETNRPRVGTLLKPRAEDSIRDYVSAGLTPLKLAAILREADDGSLSSAVQLFEEMEEKDAHLFSVANTRRLALTGLDWQIVSAHEVNGSSDAVLAEQAAAYVRESLGRLAGFDKTLQHLSLALGRNIAISEIIWDVINDELRIVDLIPVDFHRIVFDELDQPRILTEDEPRDGIELSSGKFIVHTPHTATGHPQRGGLMRVTAMAYLAKNLAMKDWMIFSEIFGMPMRIARYEPTAAPEEKRELLNMLESLGSEAAGIFSKAVELQFIESKRGAQASPYQTLVEFLNREMSKAWLGQTLTVEIGGQRGSLAASQIHELVRQDILADDIHKEAQTIRRDLLGPMVRFQFGDSAPVSHFRRRVRRAVNTLELADVLDRAVNQLGLSVSESWARESLGIPDATENDRVLKSS